jgi:hypothetical protein
VSRQSEFETRDAVDAARKHTRDRDFSL